MARNNSFFAPWKVVLGIIVCLVVLWDGHCNQAIAAGTQDLSGFLDRGVTDGKSDFLAIAKKIKDFITWGGMILSALAMLASGIAMLPFVGKKEQGMENLKVSAWWFAGFAVAEILLSWIASLLQV